MRAQGCAARGGLTAPTNPVTSSPSTSLPLTQEQVQVFRGKPAEAFTVSSAASSISSEVIMLTEGRGTAAFLLASGILSTKETLS